MACLFAYSSLCAAVAKRRKPLRVSHISGRSIALRWSERISNLRSLLLILREQRSIRR